MRQWGLLAALTLFTAAQAQAEPQFSRLYKGKYGYSPSCNACHKDGGGSPLNAYGKAFENARMNTAAFDAIAAQDSDGDGFTNGDEAKAQANPGSDGSTPKDKGNWLDTANLIPKEVQMAYPGITAYKPLDAIFTKGELKRAEKMGVTLTARDENTIYVPIKDGKPLGTAIIVPALHQAKPFFLLVTTDPKLTITGVEPINTKKVPAAAKSKAYAGLKGVNAGEVKALADVNSVDGAITAAVKKAGAILTVRLKKE